MNEVKELIVDEPNTSERSCLKLTINKYIMDVCDHIIDKKSHGIDTSDDEKYLLMLKNIKSICLKRNKF